MANRPDGTAMRKRLVHREVEAGVGLLEARAVERTAAA